MKIQTRELSGPLLNWAVAIAEGAKPKIIKNQFGVKVVIDGPFDSYFDIDAATNWAQAGIFIERERITLYSFGLNDEGEIEEIWVAKESAGPYSRRVTGETPTLAAMRCFVMNKLGEIIDIPDEVAEQAK